MLAVDAADNCFVGKAKGGVGGVFLDVDNGAGEDHLLDLVADDDVSRGDLCRVGSREGSCEGSEDRESGGEDGRLHFDIWFLDWEVGIKSEK